MQAPSLQLTNISPRRCATRYAEFAHSHLGTVAVCAGRRNPLRYSSPWQPVSPSLPPLRRPRVVGCSFSRPPLSVSRPFRGLLRFLPPCPARAPAVPSAVAPPRRPGRDAAPPRPPRRQPSPTSGYRLQPPRLWHYGHGGGDGCAEAEQAGYQGSGTISAPLVEGEGALGAEQSRSLKWILLRGGRAGATGGLAGALVPGLLFRSLSPSVWLRRRRPARPAELRLEGGREGRVGAAETGAGKPVSSDCLFSLFA